MDVQKLQHLLAYLGYYTLAVDGIAGAGTIQAVRDFQTDWGLEVDGLAGEETWTALKEAVAGDKFRQPGDFWQTVAHFRREEFRCGCGGRYCGGFPAEPQEALVRAADRLREHFAAPVTVSSGVRCRVHNTAVGGVANSRHLSGKAMDFTVAGHPVREVLAYLRTRPEIRYAYAMDSAYVHMDVE